MGQLQVLYEDNHLIAINKLPSDIVQADRTGDPTLADRVKEYVRERYRKPGEVFLGIPHRLDRPTSGVVIFARTGKALERLSAMFREGAVRKIYWALVDHSPPAPSQTLVHWLRRNPEQNKSYPVDGPGHGAKEARLTYQLLLSLDRYHLLAIELHTGRHHQIRAQLAAIGIHIKGDLKYGAARSNPGGGIHLHARSVELAHPVRREPLLIVAEPPREALWTAALEAWKARPEEAT